KTFSTFTARLNAALKSSTNCLVVIGACPTRSSIRLSVVGRKGAGCAEIGAGDEMRHRFACFAGQLSEQSSRLGESSVDGTSALGQKQTSAHVRVMSALPPKADIGPPTVADK